MGSNYFLYRHIRPDKNQVFYVGVGTKKQFFTDHKTEFRRAYEHTNRTKYWKNIVNINSDYEVEIILESNNYDFILQKEIEFIKIYGRIDLNSGTLVNLTNGGEKNNGRKVSQETKRKMSLIRTGKSKKGNKIYQYDLEGNFVKEWSSCREAERYLNLSETSINKCLTDKNLTGGGFYWSKFKKDRYIKTGFPLLGKKVEQYSLDGNFIREWKNAREVSKCFNVHKTSIGRCLIGKSKSSNGFIWKYSIIT